MAKQTRVKFESKKWKMALIREVSKEQTKRLIDYADIKIQDIGDQIQLYLSENNMDRTGNLLDSLCYGVYYNGKLEKSGYYRGTTAVGDSYLHEYSNPVGRSVNGHVEATKVIANYTPSHSGWDIFFAIAAPYWGYWESGFLHKQSGKNLSWKVMTYHFDKVKEDLAPTRVTFSIYRP